jgi:hypothetical protein
LLDCLRSLEVAGAFAAMRPQARRRYEEAYTGERNFSLLLNVYRGAMVAGSRVYPIPVAT